MKGDTQRICEEWRHISQVILCPKGLPLDFLLLWMLLVFIKIRESGTKVSRGTPPQY